MKNEDKLLSEQTKENSLKEIDDSSVEQKQESNGDVQSSFDLCSIQHDMQMMTLGSNNKFFLTTQDNSHGQAIFSSRELPQYLQKTLDESLSKVAITEDGIEKVIEFLPYQSEENLPDLTTLITKDLSEPYSIYTYRYFLHNWPQLSFLVSSGT